jgi:beta-N-acetylhexosaminidase
MNLAPVLDININPRNAVIGIRAFGDEPKQVARLGIAAIKGLQNAHIIPVGKHFPGHGGTEVDSHKKMPIVLADLPALLKGSLLPFRDAIEAKLPAIMTAHIALPKLTNNKILPATFSSEIIQGLLRKQFHFSGLIMTDALEMDAVSEHFSPAEAAIRAVLAGADMILIDWNRDHQQQVYSGLLHAYQQGRLPPKRLREAVEHILALKERYQFNKLTYIAPNKVVHALRAHYAAHEKIARDITQKALTLVEDPQTLVPIQTPLWRHILVLTPEGPFADKARMRKAQVIALPMWPNRQQRYRAIAQIKQIVPRTQKIIALLPNHHYVELFESLHKRAPKHPSIVVALNSPYFLRYLPASMTKLCTYDDDAYGQDAVYQALIGKLKAKGHMPVQWPGRTH